MARQRNSLAILVCAEARQFLGDGVALHRYANARKLLGSLGLSLAQFGERISRDYVFVTAYLGNVPKKRLGEKTARLIEHGFGLAPYALDTPCYEFLPDTIELDPNHAAQVGYAQALLESLPCEEKRQQVLALIQLATSDKITAADMRMLLLMGRHMESSRQQPERLHSPIPVAGGDDALAQQASRAV